ncbi:MAG: pseudouridine synthase [Cyclobacteriaceae bacterium]|nr:pseudouridine synthase [Cyclobacteriaceae bacterium]
MAQRRSNKRTSFGKKSEAEKSFIKRKGKPSFDKKDEDTTQSYGKSGARRGKSRPEKSDDRRFERSDFKKGRGRAERSDERESGKRDFKRRSSHSDSSEERLFKRTYGSERSGRSDSKEFGKSGYKRRTSDSSEERPFKRSSRPGSGPGKRPFEKFRTDGDEKRPFRSSKNLGFAKKKRATESREVAPKKDDGLTRLNKYIANSGMGSRREADEMIRKGLISVNGVTITEMGHKVKPGDEVRYEDKVLKAEKLVYVLLNKPKGFLTTTSDPKDRKTVMNLVASACKERLYPVGRLDRNTTGLLLLTNDGELAEKLTHPSYNTKKIYKVELDKPLSKSDFQKIQEGGVYLEEGKAIVDDLAYVDEGRMTIGIELHIGWNRIVRRIFESFGYEVVKLDRVVFAGLDKKDLPRGEWRFLKPEEVVRLKHFK